MSHEKTAVPDDLLQRKQRLEEWRTANPPPTRPPEPIWEAAVEMAQRHRLHCTTKTLRMDYMRLKKRLPAGTPPPRRAAPEFLELLAAPATGPVEYAVAIHAVHTGPTPDLFSRQGSSATDALPAHHGAYFADRAGRQHAALGKHRDTIGQRLRFLQVMGGQHDRRSGPYQFAERIPLHLPRLDIEAGGGFVQEQ
jgi:hypothetical protein